MATLYDMSEIKGDIIEYSVEWVPNNGQVFTLEELQQHVHGWIEVMDLNEGLVAVFNEEGRFNGMLQNHDATELVDRLRPVPEGASWDLHGPVLIASREEMGYEGEAPVFEQWSMPVLSKDVDFIITPWDDETEGE